MLVFAAFLVKYERGRDGKNEQGSIGSNCKEKCLILLVC